MAYSPRQPRDRYGRWTSTGSGLTVGTGTRAKSSRKRPRAKTIPSATARPTGIKGLKRSTIPYARVNKRSQTVGVNTGTIIPGTKKRVVGGAYIRLESTTRRTTADKIAGKAANRIFPKGTRRGRVGSILAKTRFNKMSQLRTPGPKGTELRLGTSRGAGPTVIVRRGKHKTSKKKSAAGIKKYNTRMRVIAGKKTKPARAQRRRAARRRR